MNYELAKKLKEVGFPYPNGEGLWWVLDMDKWKLIDTRQLNFIAKQVSEKKNRVMPEHYRVPTLSELIQACGKKFRDLSPVWTCVPEKRWWCGWGEYFGEGESEHYAMGATPEEAVGNLWLALHSRGENKT